MCFNPSPERRVQSPNRYMAFARFCFCKNNKRTIIMVPCQWVMWSAMVIRHVIVHIHTTLESRQSRQKRPTTETKETYYRGKTDHWS